MNAQQHETMGGMSDPFAGLSDLGSVDLECEVFFGALPKQGTPTQHGPARWRITFSPCMTNATHETKIVLACDHCRDFWHRWIGETFLRLTSERPDRSTDGVCNDPMCRAIVPLEDMLRIEPLGR